MVLRGGMSAVAQWTGGCIVHDDDGKCGYRGLVAIDLQI